jgi:hypothetical protein
MALRIFFKIKCVFVATGNRQWAYFLWDGTRKLRPRLAGVKPEVPFVFLESFPKGGKV